MGSFDSAVKYDDNSYEARREEAKILWQLKKYPQALLAIDEAINLNRNNITIENQDINLDIIKSDILTSQWQYQQAQKILNDVIKRSGDNRPDLYERRGIIYAKMKKFDLAEKDFNKYIELNNSPDSYIARSRFYYHQRKNFELAEQDFQKAISLDPNYTELYYQRGNIRLNYRKYNEAVEDYDKLIKDFKLNNPSIYFQRALANRWLQKRKDEVNYDLDKASKLYSSQKNEDYSKQAKLRKEQLQKSNQSILFEGEIFEFKDSVTDYRVDGRLLVDISKIDRDKGTIAINITAYDGLYGDGELTGTIDNNNRVNVKGDMLVIEAGGIFEIEMTFTISGNELINGSYVYKPIATTNNSEGQGKLLKVLQISGNPINLPSKA